MAVGLDMAAKSEDIFSVVVSDDFNVSIHTSPWVLLIATVVIAVIVAWRFGFFQSNAKLELNSAQIGFGNGTLTYVVNNSDFQIAYSIWVELATRKLGIPIDLENDVIVEVYDSWYSFFGVTRELIKTIPASKLKKSDTKKIVSLLTSILNEGIRPHLTKWQARFRHWYDVALVDEKNSGKSPQEIQKLFPEYDKLSADLQAVNKGITYYEEQLRKLTIGS
jgi:hypothetical protein